MAQKSGFFTSSGGDRKYGAAWLAQYLAAIISNGVFTTELTVTGGSGDMSVDVASGRAWINGYLYSNDAALKLTLSNADGTLNRIDLVVLRLDMTNRQITAEVVQGGYAAAPEAPALTRTSDVYELELAQIAVDAGTTQIVQTQITDKRADETVCGIVAGAVTQLSTGELLGQLKAGFDEWFANVRGQLSTDVAGNLQNEIDGKADKTHASTHATGGSDPLTPAQIGAAVASHTHGNLTSDGKIGGVALDSTLVLLVSGVLHTLGGTSIPLSHVGSGFYTGDGAASRTISLGVTPAWVLVIRRGNVWADDVYYSGFSVTGSNAAGGALVITTNGFTVYQDEAITTYSKQMNSNYTFYNYIYGY
jgi:hypothetical protein